MSYVEARKFFGKVLPDGHLSLPEELAKEVGKVYEVILVAVGGTDVYSYAEAFAREKGFSSYAEEDIARIIHESRGISD